MLVLATESGRIVAVVAVGLTPGLTLNYYNLHPIRQL